MNVVCTIDESYAQHCGVTLCSVFANNPGVECRVFLINDGLSGAARERLDRVAAAFSQRLTYCPIDTDVLRNVHISAHVSVATYFRILIPKILPTDVDKVLFMDSDIIVRGRLAQLYDLAIDRYAHAAVENPLASADVIRLGMPTSAAYFNAGVLLINLRAWRDEHVAERVLEYANANAAKLVAWDQDALNANMYGRWLKCPPIWNAQEAFFVGFSASELGVSEQELKEARSDPRIVHFTGSAKPWNVYLNHPFEGEYFNYLALTPWRGSPPPKPPPSALRKLASRAVPRFIKQGYRRLRDPLRAPEAARGD
jgi:lipopolysaccharide biosynthesis glycosyltransferase